MNQWIKNKIETLHRAEGGAVFLLVLAAFLILFMVAMTMFDTGVASGDKMGAQVAADTSSYSHAVVKARSMNVIVYANIIKRVYYSYMSTYMNAWSALVATEAKAASDAASSLFFNVVADAAAVAMAQIIVEELIEFGITNGPTLGLWGDDSFGGEIQALEKYQQYMHQITPWWGYIEGLARGRQNGAMLTASWPPPPSTFESIKNVAGNVAQVVDTVLSTGIAGGAPAFTLNVDTLPVARRDVAGDGWVSRLKPFLYPDSSGGSIIDAGSYCLDYWFSMEQLIHGIQTFKDSDKGAPLGGYDWRKVFIGLELVPVIGCLSAHLLYNNDGYMDWKIAESAKQDKDSWSQATGTISIAYRPRAGRMDDASGRKKFQYLGAPKYNPGKNILHQNEGYFAIGRSEIVYKELFGAQNTGFSGGGDLLSAFLSAGATRLGVNIAPDMWSPRWKAKGRPFLVPGETMGSALDSNPAGLSAIVHDSVPVLLLGSALGLFDANFSFQSALTDLLYLIRTGPTFDNSNIEGIPK